MPHYRQGDIFSICRKEGFELAIVFGYLGFNFMNYYWSEFVKDYPDLFTGKNPFTSLADKPVEYEKSHFLWFVAEQNNHGLTDFEFSNKLDQVFKWANQNGIVRVITNGICDINHGTDTKLNRLSDDNRAALINRFASIAEKQFNLEVTLVSLNDVFTRNFSDERG